MLNRASALSLPSIPALQIRKMYVSCNNSVQIIPECAAFDEDKICFLPEKSPINTCRPSGRTLFRLRGFHAILYETAELSTKSAFTAADCSLQIYVSLHRFFEIGVNSGVALSSSLPHEKPAPRNQNLCAYTHPV